MTAYQRGLDNDLMAHHENGIAVNVLLSSLHGSLRELRVGRLLATRHQILGTSGRNGWHVRHRAHASRSQLENRVADHVVGLRLLRKRHNHTARADNPNLLSRDLAHGIPKKFLVIERDVGNHADPRFHYVGCVQPPAHAYFEDRDLNLLACKMFEGNRGHHLEKTGMPWEFAALYQFFGGSIDFAVKAGEIVVADLLPVYADALVDAHQMWRSVKTGLQPGSAQDRRQRGGRRALAVRPRNQDAGKP